MLERLSVFRQSLSGFANRFVVGLLVVHFVLIPLLLWGILISFERGLHDQFVSDTRLSAGMLVQMLTSEMLEEGRHEVEKILDYMLSSGRVVYAEVLTNDGVFISGSGSTTFAGKPFQEDTSFGGHGDHVYYIALPLADAGKNPAAVLRLGYDERPINAQMTQAYTWSVYLAAAYLLILLIIHTILLLSLRALNHRLRKQTDIVLDRTRSLKRLSRQLITAQETERSRIARELHDSIGQSLGAIKFRFEGVLNEGKESMDSAYVSGLQDIIPLIQNTVTEVRNMSMAMRPSMLDDLGLLPTMSWFQRECAASYPDLEINMQTSVTEEAIPDALKIAIFRVMQEAFNNVVKHSQATRVEIGLDSVNDTIELTIQDNGVGFDGAVAKLGGKARPGFGITSMKERVELGEGRFFIKSTEGRGTTIRACWSVAGI